MLTEQQRDLMTNILECDQQLGHDQMILDNVKGLVDNPNVTEFTVENYSYGEYNQRIYVVVQGAQPFEWWVYTEHLITGRTQSDVDASQETLDAAIQSGITDKLPELKAIL